MFIAFAVVATFIFAFLFFIWSTDGALNTFIKTTLFAMIVWGVVVLLGFAFPSGEINSMRLF